MLTDFQELRRLQEFEERTDASLRGIQDLYVFGLRVCLFWIKDELSELSIRMDRWRE